MERQAYIDRKIAIEKMRIPSKFLCLKFFAQLKKHKELSEKPPVAVIPSWFLFLEKFKEFFWYILGIFPLGLFACIINDFLIVFSVILRKLVAFFLRLDLLQLLDFYPTRNYLLYATSFSAFKFYFQALFWPREKWLFLLRHLTWKERAFKFFMSGPFGWLGFFYYFFWGTRLKCRWLLVT